MKIGIITFWDSNDNYGQVLQCYAFQQCLIKLGHEPFLIKFLSRVAPPSSLARKCIKCLQVYPILRKVYYKATQKKRQEEFKQYKEKNQRREFTAFRHKHIISGETVYNSLREIQQDPPKADCYICGSDQVWSLSLSNPEHRAYFLDFGDSKPKRLSYAASFGSEKYPGKFKLELKHLLEKFDGISVREDAGCRICNEIGISACKVLDPTLLLTGQMYLPIIDVPRIEQEYFYLYSINISSGKEIYWDKLKQYSYTHCLKTVATTSSGYISGREFLSGTDYVYATIPQWLGYIRNAQFVATTSFHGVAFCLILHTNFIYFPLRGEFAKANNRVLSLLEEVGLLHKVCWHEDQVESCIRAEINWDLVAQKIDRMKELSFSFIKSHLGDIEGN